MRASNVLAGYRVGGALQFIIAAGVGVCLAVLAATNPPLFMIGATLSGFLFVLFLQRPDLGLLVVLFARASSDAVLLLISPAALIDPIGSLGGIRGLLLNPNTALILVLVGVGAATILSRRLPLLALPGGTLLLLLSLAGAFGIVRSDDVMYSLREWLPMLAAPVTYGLAAGLFTDQAAVRRVSRVLAASFLLPALAGYWQLLTGGGVPVGGFLRIYGTFVHPNPFGLYLVIIMAVFIPLGFQRSRMGALSRLIALASGPLLLATFARFAWIGLLIVLVCFGFLRYRLLLLVIPLIGLVLLLPMVQLRAQDPLGGSFADRVSIWRGVYSQWVDEAKRDGTTSSFVMSTLGGLGPGASALLAARFRGGITAPHNDYVRLLVDHGLVGLLLYLLLIATMIRVGLHAWRASKGNPAGSTALSFLALAIAYPVMSLTSNIVAATHNQLYFWMLGGLCVSISRGSLESVSS